METGAAASGGPTLLLGFNTAPVCRIPRAAERCWRQPSESRSWRLGKDELGGEEVLDLVQMLNKNVLVWPKAAAPGAPVLLIIHAGSSRVPSGRAALSLGE